MRLIDADAAKNKVRKEMDNADLDKLSFAICLALINMFDDAEQLPTIEAEPVRHGKWIPVDGESPCDEWDCSACRERMTFMYEMDEDDMKENFPRCPKCVAKMDGKEGEK